MYEQSQVQLVTNGDLNDPSGQIISAAGAGISGTTTPTQFNPPLPDTTPQPADPRNRPFGVSMAFVRKFLKDHPDIEKNAWTTSDILKFVIKPESLGTEKAYLDKFIDQRDEQGRLFISYSTVFVSHAWNYRFVAEVVDGMEQYALEHPDVYFWFDLFTNDQNNVVDKDFYWFCKNLRGSIEQIGEVLLLLSPWDDPTPTKRAWCLYEISSTLDMAPNVKLTVKLPAEQVALLVAGVRKDPKCILKALADVQAEKAEAATQSDLDMIVAVITRTDGGMARVNIQMKNYLRGWYLGELRKVADGSVDDALINSQVGYVFSDLGEYDVALEFHMKSLAIDLATLGENHPDTATSYGNMGSAWSSKGDYTKALEFHMKDLAIKLATLGKNHSKTATSYNNIGSAWSSKGDYTKALEFLMKCLAIYLATLGENHPDTAASYGNIGGAWSDKGDYTKGL